MNVSELIQKLQTLDPNQRVVLRGYEDGYNDVRGIVEINLILNVNHQWYYGVHAEAEKNEEYNEKAYFIG